MSSQQYINAMTKAQTRRIQMNICLPENYDAAIRVLAVKKRKTLAEVVMELVDKAGLDVEKEPA